LTKAIIAGARRPEEYVYAASTANAISSGRSLASVLLPPRPIVSKTACIPTSCRAMYGIVARIPVTATASESARLPYRPPTKSAGVTYPLRCDTDQSRAMKMKMIG
jgi:hypothetical protein